MLALWRRILREGGGPNLSLGETAALLSASLEEARIDTKPGNLRASHDDHGRVRISASVTYLPDGTQAEEVDAESIARLWTELKTAREQLEASRAAEARLQEDLEAAETALEYTKAEVANLWRVMTSRNMTEAVRKATQDSHETAKVITLAEQRYRIRSKVEDVREIARRRRWPWSLVS
jgi:hypothetical protein